MHVCPDCRAGKQYIEWEHIGYRSQVIKFTCTRCGFIIVKYRPFIHQCMATETVSYEFTITALDKDDAVIAQDSTEGGGSSITIEDLTILSFQGADKIEVECTGVKGESFAVGSYAEGSDE